MDLQEILIKTFTALIHDIGKLYCWQKTKYKNEDVISYPYHGEYGAIILSEIYNEELGKIFNKDEWNNIIRTITLHMCGICDVNNNDFSKYKLELLSVEKLNIKNNLFYLGYGDTLGKINKYENNKEFIELRSQVHESILNEFNMKNFMDKHKFDNITMFIKSDIKTSDKISDLIIKSFDNKFKYFQCENIIYQYVANKLQENYNDINIDKYKKEYNAYKFELDNNIKNEILNCFKNNIIPIINSQMLFSRECEKILPEETLKSFVISIDILNFNKNELLKEQNKLDFKLMTSLSSNNYKKLAIGKPNLIHILNTKNNFGFDILIDNLQKILKSKSENTINEKYEKILKIDDTDNMNIIDFINHAYKIHGFDKMKDMFYKLGYRIYSLYHKYGKTDYMNDIIKIEYLDNNDIYNMKWARQTRGTWFYKNGDKYDILKYALQRGKELSFEEKKYKNLDVIQIDTNKKLVSKENFEGYLSSKSDGSLITITLYSDKMIDVVKNILHKLQDPFANRLLKYAQDKNLDFIPVIGSKGTLNIVKDVQLYFMTSFLTTYKIIENDKLKKIKHDEIIDLCLDKLFNMLLVVYKNFNKYDILTLSFEAICGNKMSISERENNELAISYNNSVFNFLGISICRELKFYPHFVFEDLLLETELKQPLWWKIDNSNKIKEMLNDLSLCARNKITIKEYLIKHKPSNKKYNNDIELDYEGFILYRNEEYNYDSNKIKTDDYYKAHNYKVGNTKYLLELYKESGDKYKLAKNINDFFETIEDKLINILEFVNSVVKNQINDKSSSLYLGLNDKLKEKIDKLSNKNKIRIIVSNSVNMNIIINDAIKKYIEIKKVMDDKIISSCIKVILKVIDPQDDLNNDGDYKENIKKIVKNHSIELCEFYNSISMSI